jgi:hypothetical protein
MLFGTLRAGLRDRKELDVEFAQRVVVVGLLGPEGEVRILRCVSWTVGADVPLIWFSLFGCFGYFLSVGKVE